MGKMPVVATVGLIWAGMALVGCQNCKNCRNKNDTPPTFPAKTGAPVVKQDSPAPAVATPTVTAGGAAAKAETPKAGAAAKAETAKAADVPGTKGFAPETPAVGLPVSTGSTPSSPTIQNTLSPGTETRPAGLPGQSPDYRSGEGPVSRSSPTERGFRLPPPPVTQVGATSPAGSAEPLPALTPPSPLPPLSANLMPPPPAPPGAAPPSPGSPVPMPPISGSSIPAFDPPPK